MKTPEQIAERILSEDFHPPLQHDQKLYLRAFIASAIQEERSAVENWKNLAAKYSDDVDPLRKACQLALNEFSLLVTTRKDLRQAWDKAKEELSLVLKQSI